MKDKLDEIIDALDKIRSGTNSNMMGFLSFIALCLLTQHAGNIYKEMIKSNNRSELILEEVKRVHQSILIKNHPTEK